MQVKVTTVGASWVDGKHRGPGPWLDVVHEVNRTRPGTFGAPLIDNDPDGTYVEVYPGARVRMVGEDAQDLLVTITSMDDDVAEHMRRAAERLGLRYTTD